MPTSLSARVVDAFLGGNFSVLLILLCLGLGAAALLATPREEDPQIVVPVVDVLVQAPGASAEETQRLAAIPLERLMDEIPGVEHVYSMCGPGRTLVTVRFRVGQDRERALVNVYNKIQSNLDRVPAQVSSWIVKPVEIDDVPILTLTLYGEGRESFELLRFADEIAARLQVVEDISRVEVAGGEPRVVRVLLDRAKLESRGLGALEIANALRAANRSARAGTLPDADPAAGPDSGRGPGTEVAVEVGPFLKGASDVEEIVVGVRDARTVLLRDVARVVDGPAVPESYTRIHFGPGARAAARGDPVPEALADGRGLPAVTIAVSKRKGTNAVAVAENVLARYRELASDVLPSDVHTQVTRDYGESANEKVDELVGHLLIAVATIVVLVGASLGWREAWIVALAVPLTLAVTLFGDLLVGYTINRVTLFALILSLGLLVDDPIVDVENIHRHFRIGKHAPRLATVIAVDEVRPPTVLATFTVIVSFLPLYFVTGMMGPYMRPMPFNVPVAMLLSLAIAFTVTPWAAYHMLRRKVVADGVEDEHGDREGALVRLYRRAATRLLGSRRAGGAFLALVAAAFLGSLALAGFGWVPMKLLPFDNKSEFQVVIDAPESWGLERTDRATAAIADEILGIPEVTDVTAYVGYASPHDFNGLVRHSFLRRGGHVADLRANLLPRHVRRAQSHAILLAARPGLEKVALEQGVRIQIVETPPGPPVLAGVVAEVYGPPGARPIDLERGALEVARRMRALEYLRDVDTRVEETRPLLRYEVDRDLSARRGVPAATVVDALSIALGGLDVGAVHLPAERRSIPLRLEMPRPERTSESDLLSLSVAAVDGSRVPLSDLLRGARPEEERTLYRKDLRDVQYATAEAVGRSPIDAVLALQEDLRRKPLPVGIRAEFAGEGEWQVTVDVFRDMGIAFAAALIGIYVLLVAQLSSFSIAGLIMLAIPLTLIGIFPGFWLLNVFRVPVGDYANPIFFTATGMIGMIALAGIVVRNSILLIDFIRRNEAEGLPILEACVSAGAVRLRPILLTAGAAILGAWVIVFDPIFSGLAWSFVFGIVASTGFTVFVIPLAYAWTMGRRSATVPGSNSRTGA